MVAAVVEAVLAVVVAGVDGDTSFCGGGGGRSLCKEERGVFAADLEFLSFLSFLSGFSSAETLILG